MSPQEKSLEATYYYCARAEEERKAASQSSQSEVVLIHLELARLYDALARQHELRPMRNVAMPRRSDVARLLCAPYPSDIIVRRTTDPWVKR